MDSSHPNNLYRNLFVGTEQKIPLLDGSERTYINFDNAASTPSLLPVQKAVDDFLVFYSSVHRGTGFKSQLSTHAYEQAREIVLRFLGADPKTHTCIFGKNTTEAINKLARRFPFTPQRNIVITSGMEHHSNDLPWRLAAETIHVGLLPDGRLDTDDFEAKLKQYGSRTALVTISGASNVTGYINDIHHLAETAHAVGAQICVDCAQLAPHRKVDMRPLDDPAHLDYVSISAHKMYAPFGAGALVGRRDIFEQGDPDLRGGGTVEIVTLDDVVWAEPPERDEAGSPNTVGVVALAAAICQLESVGMDAVAAHEAELTRHALEALHKIPEVMIFGSTDPARAEERLGVIPFGLTNVTHFLAASVLGYEYGIGVRSGCFCAHPYILHLLQVGEDEAVKVRNRMLAGDRSEMPGLIRASFGLYNTIEEVDFFIDALKEISKGNYRGKYVQDRASGEYLPEGWTPEFEKYFAIGNSRCYESI
ncbi:MAG: aminotransferase class V-fold PLP-dependent enzyme [Chloroflexi bacterium]|nr:MAG: aminotransferase class V-fold PLP-dependent enzyme [Chloroflexota bacterium]